MVATGYEKLWLPRRVRQRSAHAPIQHICQSNSRSQRRSKGESRRSEVVPANGERRPGGSRYMELLERGELEGVPTSIPSAQCQVRCVHGREQRQQGVDEYTP